MYLDRRRFIVICRAGAVALASKYDLTAQPEDGNGGGLEDNFFSPPPTAYAKTWWHWMNGNVSEIGITRDLEAMKRVGVNGFQLYQVGTGIPRGPVHYGSPENVRLIRHAIAEADHLRQTGRERCGIRRYSVPAKIQDTLRFSLLPAPRVALAMKAGDHDDAGFLHKKEQTIRKLRTPGRRRPLSTRAKRSGVTAIASAGSTTALANRSPSSGRTAVIVLEGFHQLGLRLG